MVVASGFGECTSSSEMNNGPLLCAGGPLIVNVVREKDQLARRSPSRLSSSSRFECIAAM
jgi:hypothetical protein